MASNTNVSGRFTRKVRLTGLAGGVGRISRLPGRTVTEPVSEKVSLFPERRRYFHPMTMEKLASSPEEAVAFRSSG
jgi:hypothetical protein